MTPYETPGKAMARRIVIDVAREAGARTILDLWGGGESARAFREAIPEAIVTSAERDESMWAALRLDGQQRGYAYHFGDVGDVEGRFDFIWLDACSQASPTLKKDLAAMARKLVKGGYLALTIMPARETDKLFTGDDRLFILPLWIQRATGLNVALLYPYRRASNQQMWLLILTSGGWEYWTTGRFDRVVEDLDQEGIFWGIGLDLSIDLMEDLDPDQVAVRRRRAQRKKRIVKMSDLTPVQREAILAYIDVGKKPARRPVNHAPHAVRARHAVAAP